MSNTKRIEHLNEASSLSGDDLMMASVKQANDTFASRKITVRQLAGYLNPDPMFAIGPNTKALKIVDYRKSSSSGDPDEEEGGTGHELLPERIIKPAQFADTVSNPVWSTITFEIEHNGLLKFVVDTDPSDGIKVDDINGERHNVTERKSSCRYVLMRQNGHSQDIGSDDFICGFDVDVPGNETVHFIPVLKGIKVYVQVSATPKQYAFTKRIALLLYHNEED